MLELLFGVLRGAGSRVRHALRRVLLAAVTAGLAWWVATLALGSPGAIFAPIAAMVSLLDEPGARGQRAFRVIGGVLAVIAVVIAVAAKLGSSDASWLIVVPAIAGIGVAWQQAVNGRVKQTAGSATSAAVINFATGSLALALAWAVELAFRGLPSGLPSEPWLYVGGFLGIFVIGGSAALVRYTGVLVLSMGMVAGQLLGALVLDLVVPAPGAHVAVSTVVGVLLTFVAVAVASLPDRAARA